MSNEGVGCCLLSCVGRQRRRRDCWSCGLAAFLIGSEMVGLTTIRSGAANYPAVTALKALAADVRAILGAGTKVGYAGDWSEYFGHHPGDGSGDVYFHLDPLWSDANIDFIGIDNYMPISDWRDGWDHLDAAVAPAIYDRSYLQSNIAGGEGFVGFYASPVDRDSQTRTPITDGAYGKPWVYRNKDLRSWWLNAHYNRPGGVQSGTATAWVPQSKPFWFTELGCPAVDRATNQPNVFFDPKSSESFTPYFSRGWRDDAIQRAYLEATCLFWGAAANNAISSVYAAPMVHVPEPLHSCGSRRGSRCFVPRTHRGTPRVPRRRSEQGLKEIYFSGGLCQHTLAAQRPPLPAKLLAHRSARCD